MVLSVLYEVFKPPTVVLSVLYEVFNVFTSLVSPEMSAVSVLIFDTVSLRVLYEVFKLPTVVLRVLYEVFNEAIPQVLLTTASVKPCKPRSTTSLSDANVMSVSAIFSF